MKFTDKAKILAVAATIAGTASGVAIANRLQPIALTQDYWQRVISVEKQKRVSLLDEVGKFGADGSWTSDDVAGVAARLYGARIFQFWGWGDSAYIVHDFDGHPVAIPGDDTGPGEGIGHFMTWRYNEAFRPYDGLLEKLGQLYEKVKPKDIPKEKIPSAQRVEDLRILSEHRQLNAQEQEEFSFANPKPAAFDLRNTTLDQEVRDAAEAMKRVLRDPEHQKKDYGLARFGVRESGVMYYGLVGFLSMLVSGGGVAFLSGRREKHSSVTGIERQAIGQQIEMQPDAPLHSNYEQLKLPF